MEQNNRDKETYKNNGFITGLVVGLLAGGLSNFFLKTEKGRLLKKKLLKEGKNLWQSLEDSLREQREELLEIPEADDSNTLKEGIVGKMRKVKKFFVKNGKAIKR